MADSAGKNVPRVSGIINSMFCSPIPVDLAIVRKVFTMTSGNFRVQDINGNIIFKVKGAFMSTHDRHTLLDSANNPIITLRRKPWSAHERWEVFMGESNEKKDLVFSAKRSSLFQCKTKLNVFLASNTSEMACDFMVKGSWFDQSCVIYAGGKDSTTIVAKMHKKHSVKSVLMGKDHFMVTVYPNIDYVFIVAIIVILDEINRPEHKSSSSRRRNSSSLV